jgi:hypothetical protein
MVQQFGGRTLDFGPASLRNRERGRLVREIVRKPLNITDEASARLHLQMRLLRLLCDSPTHCFPLHPHLPFPPVRGTIQKQNL